MQVMAVAAFIAAGPPTSSPSLVPARRDHEAQKPYVACNALTLVGIEAPCKSAAVRALNTLGHLSVSILSCRGKGGSKRWQWRHCACCGSESLVRLQLAPLCPESLTG